MRGDLTEGSLGEEQPPQRFPSLVATWGHFKGQSWGQGDRTPVDCIDRISITVGVGWGNSLSVPSDSKLQSGLRLPDCLGGGVKFCPTRLWVHGVLKAGGTREDRHGNQ